MKHLLFYYQIKKYTEREKMEITQSLIRGSQVALNLAKTMLTLPMLMNIDVTQGGLFAIPLETETHVQHIASEVSTSLLITKLGKKNVSDNIAPGAWGWTLTGYIPGITDLEPTSYYTPFVKLYRDFIRRAAANGYILMFKDIDNNIYRRVAIASLSIDTKADCKNKTPFSMELVEINVLDNNGGLSEIVSNAISQVGTLMGSALNVGATVAQKAINTNIVKNLLAA
jgi:hypothetical protein